MYSMYAISQATALLASHIESRIIHSNGGGWHRHGMRAPGLKGQQASLSGVVENLKPQAA